MKIFIILTCLLAGKMFAGQPTAVVSKQKVDIDTTYLVPTIPFDGSKSELRLIIKTESYKPKGIEREGNFPMKYNKFKIYLNGKKLTLPKGFISQLPPLQAPWNRNEVFIIPLADQGIRLQFNLANKFFLVDLSHDGKIDIPKIKTENKMLR